MSHPSKLDMPFGWSQGDPCVVCINELHRIQVIAAFKLRAHYILPLSAICGRRYNKIIVFRAYMPSKEDEKFSRWIEDNVRTSLEVGGEFYLV